MNLEQYKQRNNQIVNEINDAERTENYERVIELKRELYNNKIKMLDLLTVGEEEAHNKC